MKRRRQAGSDEASIDMTPMLDIVFIMLIFFIVTSTFLQETGVVMIPAPSNQQPEDATQARSILVQIDRNSSIFINGRLTDIARVTAAIQRANVDNGGQSGVVIQGDPDSEHGVIVGVYDAATAAGVVGGVVIRPPERQTL